MKKISPALPALALLLLVGCGGRTLETDDAAETDVTGSTSPPASPCEDEDDCEGRALCIAGVCEAISDEGCMKKSECPAGQVCIEGTCGAPQATCSSTEECLGSLVCDGFSSTCVDLNATGCAADSECALEPGCTGGCRCEADGACVPATGDGGGSTTGGGGSGGGGASPPSGATLDLSGYRIENQEHSNQEQVGILPDGTLLAPGQLLVLGRSATRADFQTYWETSFGSDVVYLDAGLAGAGVPNVNGGERWAIISPVGTVVDLTIAGDNKDSCYHRQSAGAGTSPSSWSEGDLTSGRPGTTALPTSGVGLVFSQWCDADIYQYEFLELYYAP